MYQYQSPDLLQNLNPGATAENLFWLGRYTQRVYTVLHFFRKFQDILIGDDEFAYDSFCRQLGVENKYESADDFLSRYLFDNTDSNSLISALTYAHDNALVLREEIKSENLAYVELCLDVMEEGASKHSDVNELQIVSDSLMAFWGAADDRIFKREVRNMIKAGWRLEALDLHIRFDYPQERLLLLLYRLERHLNKEEAIFDQKLFFDMKAAVQQASFNKNAVLAMLASLYLL
jgi:uncharacterized alpha-E superfamily protein